MDFDVVAGACQEFVDGLTTTTPVAVPVETTELVLQTVGHDFLVALSVSVIVTPLAKQLKTTPILLYLAIGAVLGPNALNLFANVSADTELGDFGILFLLFLEGLEVTPNRLGQLANYFPLGLANIASTVLVLGASIAFGLADVLDKFLPLDETMVRMLDYRNPVEIFILAAAASLSTSAFVFPVLKERGWEADEGGKAATSLLLLEDLSVAPLLILMPFVVGNGPVDVAAIGSLLSKAVFGFGSLVYIGSLVLRPLFSFVSKLQSTQTFVALCLLVSVGMGTAASELGLTDTVGAFAAGVLLANTNYKAEIKANLIPFEGILCGIFFLTAGANFDLQFTLKELPSILTAITALLILKSGTTLAVTKVPFLADPKKLDSTDHIRLALLLCGGGEFAFVVVKQAEKLGALPESLGDFLTAVVLISMAATPLLGDAVGILTDSMEKAATPPVPEEADPGEIVCVDNAIVVCGYGKTGKAVLRICAQDVNRLAPIQDNGIRVAAFDTVTESNDIPMIPGSAQLFGDGTNPDILRLYGIANPENIFVTYSDFAQTFSGISRLRPAFPDAPIFARAKTRKEAQKLRAAGATEVIVEGDLLQKSVVPLLRGIRMDNAFATLDGEELSRAMVLAGVEPTEKDDLMDIFKNIDLNHSGLLSPDEIRNVLDKCINNGDMRNEDIEELNQWFRNNINAPLAPMEFFRMYVNSSSTVRDGLRIGSSGDLRNPKTDV